MNKKIKVNIGKSFFINVFTYFFIKNYNKRYKKGIKKNTNSQMKILDK